MPFGQVVIGPPGSGKTTYCNGAQQLLSAGGRRVALVNLDPANDVLPYTPDVDVCDLVCLESVMDELGLGPNGGLVYCIDYLEQNLDWLYERLAPLEAEGAYFMFDCPGQVELFTQHGALRRILDALGQGRAYRLASVHLVDAHLCTEPSKYIAALLLCLGTMLHLELPHVNVLSKVDLLRSYGPLDFSLDFYTEVQDLSYLVMAMGQGRFGARHRKLSGELCELVQDFGLVSFLPLAIEDKESLQAVLHQTDRANGALYASLATPGLGLPPELLYGSAHRAADDDVVTAMQERYVEGKRPQQQQQQQQGVVVEEEATEEVVVQGGADADREGQRQGGQAAGARRPTDGPGGLRAAQPSGAAAGGREPLGPGRGEAAAAGVGPSGRSGGGGGGDSGNGRSGLLASSSGVGEVVERRPAGGQAGAAAPAQPAAGGAPGCPGGGSGGGGGGTQPAAGASGASSGGASGAGAGAAG